MTERQLSAQHLTDLDRSDSPHALLWFLLVEHPSFAEPLRVVSDWFEYEVDGNLYIPAPFSAAPLTDSDSAPSAEITLQNVDRRISETLETEVTGTRAIVSAFAYSSEDFDLSADPRVATTPASLLPVYSYQRFELADVQGNALTLTGRITLVDVTQEPYPFHRATSDRFPGLFA